MCTELGGGLTSFGQHESDREGLQTARIQMEITKRGFKGMLYFLDLANRSFLPYLLFLVDTHPDA